MTKYLITALALLPAWTAASAQEARDIRVRVGAGAQLQPRYPGADTSKLGPLLKVSLAHGSDPFRFAAPDDSPSIALFSAGPFSFGPAVNLVESRRDSDVGAPVGKVPTTFEAGGFIGYALGDWRLRGEVLKGLGGHKGLRGQIGLDRVWRDGDKYVFSIGPRLLIADERFERSYFAVTPAAAVSSGLPVYTPRRGIYGVAAATGLSVELSPRWGIFGYARYERLVGDAAKSPIVRRFGSRDQVSGGIGLSYTFVVKR